MTRPSPLSAVEPKDWPRPKGYSNGMIGEGRILFVAGQIGWDVEGKFAPDFHGQLRQALTNILAVVKEAGGGPEHIARLTWYVRDMEEYTADLPGIGKIYREIMGKNFPAMAVLQVTRFVEPLAKLEIEATAILPN